jgi:hypothetical protein
MKETLKKKCAALLLGICAAAAFVDATPADASIGRTLTVINHATEARVVYYRGTRVGVVPPRGFLRVPIGDWSGNSIRLDARGVLSGYTKFAVIHSNIDNFRWDI